MSPRVDIEKYLPFLRDPADGGELRLEDGPRLVGVSSGLSYGFIGDFPDLRPGHELATELAAREPGPASVESHYDQEPCNNYLALDNLPLGRYLRDPEYEPLFRHIDFLVEVGCGKGAVARAFKENRGLTPFCIDVAFGSLRHVRSPPLEADGVLGSNLSLPLADSVADMVVSSGVIHHTPDPMRSLIELARVLKPGGKLLLGVYNWDNPYRSLYFFFSPPLKAVRRLLGRRLGDLALKLTIFLPYHLALWLVLGLVQRRWSFPGLRDSYEQFSDFFLTPFARFYRAEELATMGELVGLRLLESDTGGWPRNGFSHFAWYEKL